LRLLSERQRWPNQSLEPTAVVQGFRSWFGAGPWLTLVVRRKHSFESLAGFSGATATGGAGGQIDDDDPGVPVHMPPCHGRAGRHPCKALAEETGEARLATAKGGGLVFIFWEW